MRLSAVGAQPLFSMEVFSVMDTPCPDCRARVRKTVKSVHCTLKETEKTGPTV